MIIPSPVPPGGHSLDVGVSSALLNNDNTIYI